MSTRPVAASTIGCEPVGERSRMASRRKASSAPRPAASGADSHAPASSGPRCASAWLILARAARFGSSSRPRIPAIPHMLLLLPGQPPREVEGVERRRLPLERYLVGAPAIVVCEAFLEGGGGIPGKGRVAPVSPNRDRASPGPGDVLPLGLGIRATGHHPREIVRLGPERRQPVVERPLAGVAGPLQPAQVAELQVVAPQRVVETGHGLLAVSARSDRVGETGANVVAAGAGEGRADRAPVHARGPAKRVGRSLGPRLLGEDRQALTEVDLAGGIAGGGPAVSPGR